MSLSIPHLLRAAVEHIPGAKIRTSERAITVRELDDESRAAALRWLAAGCRPGDEVSTADDDLEPLIERLGASRIGLVVAEDGYGVLYPDLDPNAVGEDDLPEIEVLEDAVHSSTPLWRSPSGTVHTHGDAITAALAGESEFPMDLVALVRALSE